MVKVAPLDGITYNLNKVNIEDVIAPPYDVISDEEQDKLYKRSPYNIVRLILNKISENDTDSNNRYTRASQDFSNFLKDEALTKAQKPCIYYYIQNYTTPKGQKISRKGFIAKNYIESFDTKNVLPHEYTMGGPKLDRLNLTKACKANFSQIFMVYSDPERLIDKAVDLSGKPFIDVTDDGDVQNIVYIIDDEKTIQTIQNVMKDKTLLIADGHHRYETAIAYRDYMREQNPNGNPDASYEYVMSYYTNLDDENLLVFPTHRIITRQGVDKNALVENIKKYFDVVEFSFDATTKDSTRELFVQEIEKAAFSKITFGLCVKGENKYFLLKLREVEEVNALLQEQGVPDVLKKLDLSVLHKVVVSKFLNFSDEDQMSQNGIKYIKKEEEAFEALDNGMAEMIFVMASPKIKDIKDVSQEGYRMPQKSTYFYPKLLSGIVINPLD